MVNREVHQTRAKHQTETIRSQSETEFVIEVDSDKDSVNMSKIKKLHNAVVKIEECKNVFKSKGLIYLYG